MVYVFSLAVALALISFVAAQCGSGIPDATVTVCKVYARFGLNGDADYGSRVQVTLSWLRRVAVPFIRATTSLLFSEPLTPLETDSVYLFYLRAPLVPTQSPFRLARHSRDVEPSMLS